MNNTKYLIPAFAFAMAISGIALAEQKSNTNASAEASTNMQAPQTVNNADTPDMPTVTERDIEEGMDQVADTVEDTYEDIKAALINGNNESSAVKHVVIDSRMTASGILGKSIYNNAGEDLGSVDDIILGANGDAEMVVISHGGFLGIGDKLAAFDYSLVMRRDADGDVVMPLSEKTIENARAFSYDREDADAETRVLSANSISAKELLDGELLDHTGAKVAEIDNLYFKGGRADGVIFSVNETLGIGGDKVLADYASLSLSRADGDFKFRMNEAQSRQFESFRKTAMK